MIKIILVLLLITSSAHAELALEVAQNKTQMEWKGASQAKYDYKLNTLGLVWFDNDSGFGARFAYGKGRKTLPQPGAAIPNLVIELKHSIDVEVLYRHILYGSTYAYYGLGYYFDNLPIEKLNSDYYKDDWDSGVGYMAGLEHRMNSYLSIQANIRKRASVGAAKSNSGALGSSHNSIGVSIRYIF